MSNFYIGKFYELHEKSFTRILGFVSNQLLDENDVKNQNRINRSIKTFIHVQKYCLRFEYYKNCVGYIQISSKCINANKFTTFFLLCR